MTADAETLAGLLDAASPGLVEGLYLVGSAALDDYRPGVSDLDFVAVLREDPTPSAVAALAGVHRGLRRTRPLLDGCYVTRADLAAGPDSTPPRPGVHAHRFAAAARFGLDPVTWHTLARHALTVRGAAPATLDIHRDDAALRAWTRANVRGYWRRWLRGRAPLLLSDWGVAWGVLGLARMRYTVDTGDVASKRAAGEHALGVLDPVWHPILEEALRLRSGAGAPRYGSRIARARAASAFMHAAVTEVGGDTA